MVDMVDDGYAATYVSGAVHDGDVDDTGEAGEGWGAAMTTNSADSNNSTATHKQQQSPTTDNADNNTDITNTNNIN